MLLRFSVKNFGPFAERTVLDMCAAAAYKELPCNVMTSSSGEPVLRTAAIYGANAAGKSQLVRAYLAFRSIVLQSFSGASDRPDEDAMPAVSRFYSPYAFARPAGDIEFEAEFSVNGGDYRYGFTYDRNSVTSEWLYFVNAETDRQSMILERFEDIEFGASVRGECSRYRYLVSDNTLVLSLFSKLNLKTNRFSEVMGCIEGLFVYGSPSHADSFGKATLVFDHGFDARRRERLLSFLRAIDVGIRDIHVEKRAGKVEVRTVHFGEDGERYELPLTLESDGTIKAIVLFFILERASKTGGGLVIDELSSELHPLLARYMVALFHRDEAGGQLIFTTHDSSLLDKSFMRRDQIWFVEKDDFGRASLYSLVEFRLKPGAPFERKYLSGVFGSVPRLGDFAFGGEGDAQKK